jgi:hypothetical protein
MPQTSSAFGGIISNTLKGMQPDPEFETADTASYEPERRVVDAAKETVSGQLDRVLSSGSPLLERARAGATQTANSRGLINSTMAAQAGEAAAIDAALPIASADAGVYGNVAAANQQFGNQAGQFNAGATNTAELQKTAAANQGLLQKENIAGQTEMQTKLQEQRGTQAKELAGIEIGAQKELQTMRGEQAAQIENIRAQNQTALQELRGGQAEAVLAIENEYRNLLQTSASATNLYGGLLNAMTSVATNSTMDTAAKQQAVTNMTQWLEAGLGLLGGISGYDLGSLLTFG